ncbi:TraB/GumN family protein [Puia dinghuensis]|uniref:Lipoprotein n=1 Tax=Puia dinghuensis TaxID=1792502 RepID=A0A8J2U715_9BACT|nr:TraB/GumN family protein [Puia dinghuensis]GGA83464.1 lipoprotein [Puia dinghuensis]
MRKTLLLAAGILTASLAFSQTPHTLLWRISGKNMSRPSYLFGTMHVLCSKDAALSDSLKAAIAGCDELYFEINLSDMAGMLNSMKYMRMNDNQKLSDLLKPDEYARVKDYFARHASMLPFSLLERFKPMLISGLVEEQALDCETTDGMELMIMKEARHSKPINGLETAEFQAGLFDSIPYETQAKELVNYIDSSEENKQMTRQLVDLYNHQDLDGIDELSRKEEGGMTGYMDLLLYGRNRKWAKNLDGLLGKKSLLVAVGAAHLPGSTGVIELLRKEGYTVEPVKN